MVDDLMKNMVDDMANNMEDNILDERIEDKQEEFVENMEEILRVFIFAQKSVLTMYLVHLIEYLLQDWLLLKQR